MQCKSLDPFCITASPKLDTAQQERHTVKAPMEQPHSKITVSPMMGLFVCLNAFLLRRTARVRPSFRCHQWRACSTFVCSSGLVRQLQDCRPTGFCGTASHRVFFSLRRIGLSVRHRVPHHLHGVVILGCLWRNGNRNTTAGCIGLRSSIQNFIVSTSIIRIPSGRE